jgi:lipopolysaccharide/colanic/teichoic acid biosynthesis glycosyltransferase
MLADIAIHPNEALVRRLSDPSVHTNMRVLVRHSSYDGWKSLVDICLAVLLFGLALPVILLAALAVKLTSRGPMFYTQVRLGRFGQRFRILKIRTMYHDCERASGARWALPNDIRVTRVGALLRKLHLDELPQLWNVIRGDMSLVGPRPERPEFTSELGKHIIGYNHRLLVKPGMTGLAQVQIPPDTDLDSVRRKLCYDLHYMRNCSFWLDVRIILTTILYLLRLSSQTACRLCRVPGAEVVENTSQAREVLAGKPLGGAAAPAPAGRPRVA